MLSTWLLAVSVAVPVQDLDETFEVWLCPVHRDEQSVGPGECPVEGRDLVKRILVSSYSCPMHQHIDEDHEGKCPICSMNLAPMTRELQWFCPDNPEILSAEPGECPDGSSMHIRSIAMAHGDHNPKHGGVLFMAPNGYNHLEGTLDVDGNFRLYLYNDFTKPIDATPFEVRVDDIAMKPIFSSNAVPIILPRHLVQDIDTPEDWVRAELMFEVLQNQTRD